VEVALHGYWDGISELLGFTDSEDFPPIRLQFGLVDCDDLFFIENFLLQAISSDFYHLLIVLLLHCV
jgi:hypothetical protein